MYLIHTDIFYVFIFVSYLTTEMFELRRTNILNLFLLSYHPVRFYPDLVFDRLLTGFPLGHTISFSSSSGDQTSSVYHERKQGYYTYFLIKVLQESKGELTMQELFDPTASEVKRATLKINKLQQPQLSVSAQLGEEWKDIRLKQLPAVKEEQNGCAYMGPQSVPSQVVVTV